jgi:hypothetical protein
MSPSQTVEYRSEPTDWFTQFTAPFQRLEGADCCAPDSVSFHYIRPGAMRRLDQVFYGGGGEGKRFVNSDEYS